MLTDNRPASVGCPLFTPTPCHYCRLCNTVLTPGGPAPIWVWVDSYTPCPGVITDKKEDWHFGSASQYHCTIRACHLTSNKSCLTGFHCLAFLPSAQCFAVCSVFSCRWGECARLLLRGVCGQQEDSVSQEWLLEVCVLYSHSTVCWFFIFCDSCLRELTSCSGLYYDHQFGADTERQYAGVYVLRWRHTACS